MPKNTITYRTTLAAIADAATRYAAMTDDERADAERAAVATIASVRSSVLVRKAGTVRYLVGSAALVTGNTKLDKGEIPTVGIAHLPADRFHAWAELQRDTAHLVATLASLSELDTFAQTGTADASSILPMVNEYAADASATWARIADATRRLTLCPWSTSSCRALCLASSGHYGLGASAGMGEQVGAMGWRTVLFLFHPDAWVAASCRELRNAARRVRKAGGTELALRPSVTDDVLHPESLLTLWRAVVAAVGIVLTVYRYTKAPVALVSRRSDHVTLSWHENRKGTPVTLARRTGLGVATVAMPGATFTGVRTIDGDETDYRPGDDTRGGAVVVLTYKSITDGRSNGPIVAAAIDAGFIVA